jgi:hypothetical protein
MSDALALSIRVSGTLAGLLLLYAAFFLYPDERRAVQSTLEDWWVRLDDLRKDSLAREPILIQAVAGTARRGFEWLFGEPLSKRFFAVSGLLSMLSFTLAMSLFGDYGWAVPSGLLIFALFTLYVVFHWGSVMDRTMRELHERESSFDKPSLDLYLYGHPHFIRDRRPDSRSAPGSPGAASSPNAGFGDLEDLRIRYGLPFRRPPGSFHAEERPWWDGALQEAFPYVLAFLVSTSSTGLVFAGARERGVDGSVFFLAILTAFASDGTSILVTMWLLDKLEKAKTGIAAAGWLVLDALVVAAMLLIPVGLFWLAGDALGAWSNYLVFVASANLSTAAPSVVLVLVAVALVTHRALWPLLLRPFYNIVHAERMKSSKLQGTVGIALLASAWPQVFEPFRPLVRTLLDFF